MDQTQLTQLSAAVAGGITLVSVLIAAPWRATSGRLAALPAVGIGVGFAVAMRMLVGPELQVLPPKEGWQWLFWLGVIVALGGVLEMVLGERKVPRLLCWIVLIVGSFALLGVTRMQRAWSAAEAVQWIGLSSALALAAGISGDRVARVVAPRAVLSGWALAVGVGAGVIILLGKVERLSNMALMLAAEVGVLLLVTLIFPKFRPGWGVWCALATLFIGVVTASMDPWHAYLPVNMAAFVLAAPLACWAALLADRNRWWAPPAVVMIATLAILVWPIGHAIEVYQSYREMGFAFLGTP